MALRLWSRRTHGLSQLVPACQLLCNNLSTVKASCGAHASAFEDGHATALEEPSPSADRKKERLSRQERTALVESFVIKHMEAHAGAFPSVSVVLKETGGGRSAVKGILSDVEARFAQSAGKLASLENFAAAQSSDSSETSGDDSGDSDEVEAFVPEGVSGEVIIDSLGRIPEADKKSVTFTNGQMIGSSHGEIETHSGLWSRLRKLGSQAQGSKQDVSSSAASNVDERRQDVTTGSVALSFSDMSDLDVKKEGEKDDANGQEALNPNLEERHGLFVRYLSPLATPADLKEAFGDCGDIVRAQAIKPRTHQKFTYGFVDFKTSEALQKALGKEKVYIKGVRIRKEPSSSSPKTPDRNGNSNPLTLDFSSPKATEDTNSGSFLGPAKAGAKATGYSVTVEGVPLHIPLTAVKKALSKYGNIAVSSRKMVGQGDYTAHVEFKGDDARKRALSARTVELSGMRYTILRVDPVKTAVVRLSNVGAGMSTEQIQASCEQIGRVDKVVTRCDGIVDVYFNSTELENMPRIMNRLNEVNLEGEFWQAQPSACIDPSSFLSLMRTRDGQGWLQTENERMLDRVESALRHLLVDVEDLQSVVKMKREYTAS